MAASSVENDFTVFCCVPPILPYSVTTSWPPEAFGATYTDHDLLWPGWVL